MKVLHVITNYAGMGGAEKMLSRLIESLPEAEHHIVSLMQISDLYLNSVTQCKSVTALNWHLMSTPSVVFKLKKIIEDIEPDAIQGWMYHANVLATVAHQWAKTEAAMIWGVHHSLAAIQEESLSTKIALNMSRLLSKVPQAIIFCAESGLIQHNHFGFKNKNNVAIPNGIPMNEFSAKKSINAHKTIVGFAGRYHEAKGFPYLFEAISLVQQSSDSVSFSVAGRDVSYGNSEISKLVAHHTVDPKRITLLDQVTDMPIFYNTLDLFVLSSITEGFPNVLVEAMASGVPCVTTNVGDAAVIVRDAGLVVESKSGRALADAILQYVVLRTSEKLALSVRSRDIVAKNYGLDAVAKAYLAVWTRSISMGCGQE